MLFSVIGIIDPNNLNLRSSNISRKVNRRLKFLCKLIFFTCVNKTHTYGFVLGRTLRRDILLSNYRNLTCSRVSDDMSSFNKRKMKSRHCDFL